MPDSEGKVIYERERGHRYTIINGFSRSDGNGGRVVRQELQAHFKTVSPINQMGVFDAAACARSYVNSEIASGQTPVDQREKRYEETLKLICDFIENHKHFTREGGLNLIWRQKTEEERVAEMKARAEAMRKQAEEMEAALKKKDVAGAEKLSSPVIQKKDPDLVRPVGVTGGGSIAGART